MYVLLALGAAALAGPTWTGLAIVGLLAAIATDRRPRAPEVGARAEAAIVLGLTAFVLLQSVRGEAWDEPLGQDANRYLKNAWAIGIRAWPLYHPWRGPLHALLVLALPGGLVPASKALSIAATVATVPATWWLGRAHDRRTGLIAAFLLAAWPDLWWTARFSTPYPLLALLVVLGLGCAVRPGWWVAGAGVAFALAIATDLRAQGVALTLAIAALAVRRWPLAGAMLAATLVSRGLLLAFPAPLEPVTQQIQEHSRLLAEIPECAAVAGAAVPTDGLGPCGRHLLLDNLGRTWTATPVSPLFLAGLAALGAWRWRTAALAPIVLLVPAFLGTLMAHRYLVPWLPLGFVLVAAGIGVLAERSRLAWGIAPVLAVGWWLWPGTLWARANDPVPGKHRFVVPRGAVLPMTVAARALEAAPASDRLVDCATADLEVRFYPRKVLTIGAPGRLSARCARLLADGPEKDGTTWVMVNAPPEVPRWDGWEAVWTNDGPVARDLVVLRGRR